MRLPVSTDRECRRFQALTENLPAEERTKRILLIDATAKQIGVEPLEFEQLAQVLRSK